MQVSDILVDLGEDALRQLLRSVSIGKLKTYQLYDRIKARARVPKLNVENLRKAGPRLWQRLTEQDQELASDLAQAVLVSNLEMVRQVLDFLGVPHQDGFFAKDIDASSHLTEGWQQRVYDNFRETHPEALLRFYINHLALELAKATEIYSPAGAD